MTISHHDLVKALAKPGGDILKTMTPDSMHVLHMLIGLAGEVGELIECKTRENAVEEGGDLYFYLEGLWQGTGLMRSGATFAFDPDIGSLSPAQQVVVYTGRVIDAIKKSIVYGKPMNAKEVASNMDRLDAAISWWLSGWNVSRKETIDANIVKLSKRYSSGSYSNAQAQTRADKLPEDMKESQVLLDHEVQPAHQQVHTIDVTVPGMPKSIEDLKPIPDNAWGIKPEDYGTRFDHIGQEESKKGKVSGE